MHDDNFGPYYCLPRHDLKKENFRIVLGLQRHDTVIQAVAAEAIASVYLDAIEKARLILPEWLWMLEASASELFSATRRKFGEVLLRADLAVPKPMDFSLLLGLRLPGQFLHIEG